MLLKTILLLLFFVFPAVLNASKFRLKQKYDSEILKNNSMNNQANLLLISLDSNATTSNILDNNTLKISEKAKNFLNEIYYSFSFMEDELIKRIIFVMMLVFITIVICCLSLQVLISLTKNCRLALNEISYREKKQKTLGAFQEF